MDKETIIKSLVRESLNDIDRLIQPSSFRDDWTMAGKQKNKKSFQWFPAVIWVPATLGLCITLWLFFAHSPVPEPLLSDGLTPSLTPIVNIDANESWSSPTDELLLVNVRRYEYQQIHFATYDPFTMEIR